MFSALEYSRVGVATEVPPLHFANHPHTVDRPDPGFPSKVLGKLVPRGPDGGT